MGNLKNQKKKGMELYEKLEKDLTQFELEEEEEIAALMANEHLVSEDEASDDDNIRIHDDQNGDSEANDKSMKSSVMIMASQELDDDAKMQAIQDKIDKGDYNLDTEVDAPPVPIVKDKDDLFFATEIETDY